MFREVSTGTASFEYDVLYGDLGSDIVHSGPHSATRSAAAILGGQIFVLRPMPMAAYCMLALAISNIAMLLVLESLDKYIGLDLRADIDRLKAIIARDPDEEKRAGG